MATAKVREVIARLESEGWKLVRQEGSHRHFRHPDRPHVVTVAGKMSADIPVGTYGNIKRKAGW